MDNGLKNKLYKMVQDYLKPCPLIIWGSGATIPFGLPSMQDLKNELGIQKEGNLEDILSGISVDENKGYEKKIFNIVNRADSGFRESLWNGNNPEADHVKKLMCYFYKSHPRKINITTTNYDCVLEYICSYHGLPYSDGFPGREFSQFNESYFLQEKCINLYKVHGSLRWSEGRYSYYNSMMDGIFPSRNKFQRSHEEPYRTIITKSDQDIKSAGCFLSIGFGFNDEHITPKIEDAITEQPIVLVSKKATESCREKLKKAKKYVLIEESENTNETRFSFKGAQGEGDEAFPGKYWQIKQFNQILGRQS